MIISNINFENIFENVILIKIKNYFLVIIMIITRLWKENHGIKRKKSWISS